jgi:superfamily II DNA helicase RecQ
MQKRFRVPDYSSPLSETVSDLAERVRTTFNLKEIRDWQSRAFDRLVHGDDIMVHAGTGSGKSLVFQGMALLKPKVIVLVISPLISLMQDQVIISPWYKTERRKG